MPPAVFVADHQRAQDDHDGAAEEREQPDAGGDELAGQDGGEQGLGGLGLLRVAGQREVHQVGDADAERERERGPGQGDRPHNWNQDVAKRTHFEHAVWGRGTASGGGMYPVELYLVSGASGPLLPGVYHYHTGQHVLERLLLGDVGSTVRAALGAAGTGDSFLLAAIRFWKNSFEYNSFCYHVVTQDLGALLGSWELLAGALGVPLRRLLCFDPAPLDRLLGFDSDQEGVFAVVPVEWADDGPPADRRGWTVRCRRCWPPGRAASAGSAGRRS